LAVFIAFSWLMRQALSPGAAARGYLFLAVEFGERGGGIGNDTKNAGWLLKVGCPKTSFPPSRE
jgi:hypothetical protein